MRHTRPQDATLSKRSVARLAAISMDARWGYPIDLTAIRQSMRDDVAGDMERGQRIRRDARQALGLEYVQPRRRTITEVLMGIPSYRQARPRPVITPDVERTARRLEAAGDRLWRQATEDAIAVEKVWNTWDSVGRLGVVNRRWPRGLSLAVVEEARRIFGPDGPGPDAGDSYDLALRMVDDDAFYGRWSNPGAWTRYMHLVKGG